MANELKGPAASGLTAYFVVYNAAGQVWNGFTFVAATDVARNLGAIEATELGTQGVYVANAPAFAAGEYPYELFRQIGILPATTDTLLAAGGEPLRWDGTALVTMSTAAAIADAGQRIDLAAVRAAGKPPRFSPYSACMSSLKALRTNDLLTVYDYDGGTHYTYTIGTDITLLPTASVGL